MPMSAFDRLADQKTVLVTTFRRDGTGVPTPMHIAVQGDRAYLRSWSASGKAKRLRRQPMVVVAPSTWRGRPKGEGLRAGARLLEGADEVIAGHLLDAKYPLVQGKVVHLIHRLRGYRTVHYELWAED